MWKCVSQELEKYKEEVANKTSKYHLSDFDFETNTILATFQGPKGTPYEGGTFVFKVYFVKDYPYRKPKITGFCLPPHPCISNHKIGLECLGKREVAHVFRFTDVLDNIALLYERPELGYAVDKEALKLYLEDREKFNEEVRAAIKKGNKK